jgi:hypothetical protein
LISAGLKRTVANTDNKVHLICHIFCIDSLPFRQVCNNLYRDRASAQINTQYTLTISQAVNNLVPRHTQHSRILGTRTAKNAPWPPLHRDNFPAKVPRSCPVLRRSTQTHFIAGPLAVIGHCHKVCHLLKMEQKTSQDRVKSGIL